MKTDKTATDTADSINRIVIHETPKLLRPKESFFFDGKVYTSEDESIMVRTSASAGKLFAPTNTTKQ